MELTKTEIDESISEFAEAVHEKARATDAHVRIAMHYLKSGRANPLMLMLMNAVLERERKELLAMVKGLDIMRLSATSVK